MEPLKLLIVEDNEDDLVLIVRAMRRGGYELTWERVQTAEEMRAALAGGEWDVILSDHKLPSFSAPAALAVAQQDGRDIPFIVVSGTIGEEVAVGLMKAGAHDYVMKSNLARLPEVVRREMREAKVRAEHRQAEEALRASEEKYRLLIESAGEGIFVAQDGAIRYANPKAAEISGYSSEELTSKTLAELVPPEDRARVLERYAVRLAEHEFSPADTYRIIRRSGETRWVELSATLIQWAGKRATLNFVSDITARKQAEEALREKTRQSQILLDAFPCVALLLRPQTREIIASNAAAVAVGAVPGAHCFSTWGQRKDPCPWCLAPALWASGEAQHLEVEALGIFWDAHWIPVADDLYMHFAFDVTTRKQAEGALRESREMAQTLMNATSDAAFLMDPEGTALALNDETARRLGRPKEELLGKCFFDYLPPEVAEFRRAKTAEVARSGQPVRFEDERSGRLIDNSMYPLFDAQGNVTRVAVFGRDITEQRRAEKALWRQSQYLAALQETTLDLLSQLDLDRLLENIVRRAGQLFDTPSGQLDLYDPQSNRLSTRVWLGKLAESPKFSVAPGEGVVGVVWQTAQPLVIADYDTWPHRVSGYSRNLLGSVMAVPLFSDGQVIGVLVLTYDRNGRVFSQEDVAVLAQFARFASIAIENARLYAAAQQELAERKRAEERIRRSEAALNKAQQVAHVGNWAWHIQSNRLEASDQTYQILGIDRDDFTGGFGDVLASAIHPDDRSAVVQASLTTMNDKKLISLEFRIIRPDGAERAVWVETGEMILDEAGNPALLTGIIQDITDRKQAERALRQSEEKYRTLTENSPDLIARFDGQLRHLYVNPAAAMAGLLSPEEYVGKTIGETGVPDAARELWEGRIRRVFETGQPLNVEDAFPTPQGARFYHNHLTPELAADGSVHTVLSVARDITERKQAEQLRLEQEQELAAIYENAPAIMMVMDGEGRIQRMNALAARFSGRAPAEALGLCCGDVLRCIHAQDVPEGCGHGPACQLCMIRLTALETIESGRGYYQLEGSLSSTANGAPKELSYMLSTIRLQIRERPVALVSIVDITERKQMEEQLRRSEERYRGVSEAAVAAISIIDPDENIIFTNPALAQMLGYTLDELVGMNLAQLVTPDEFVTYRELTEKRKSGANSLYETRMLRKDGTVVELLVSASPLRAADGRFEGSLGVAVDITERKRAEEARVQLEEQLDQSRKLESVGLLAGGVSHDLNNMLVPILGYAEMLRDELPAGDARRGDAQEIIRAGGRARDLVRQLLAFARKQILEMKLLDLNEVINDSQNMLRRTLREDIAIETVLAPGLGVIKGGVGQIEQVLMNLCVNAQDAMPQGGTLRIETSAVTLDGSHAEMAVGNYVQMAVSDSGVGMDKETVSRIFEPFFTTKEVGKGTGLGLATVYGIIKQHGGHIEVESRLGQGSTFRVYWPQVAQPVTSDASAVLESVPARGAETILVAEDQDVVRALTCRILTNQGYQVLAAENGVQALELAAAHAGEIHLLLSDVVMPGLNGRLLYEQLAAVRPGLRVIYMSGYSGDVIGKHGVLDEGVVFIEKPFTMQTLTGKVREVLDM
jgi:two-component system cell cycle sensor histidine kinase/response regulator CckA